MTTTTIADMMRDAGYRSVDYDAKVVVLRNRQGDLADVRGRLPDGWRARYDASGEDIRITRRPPTP